MSYESLQKLGEPPYEFIEVIDLGSTCDNCQLCGTDIRYQYWFVSFDRKKFYIGSECYYTAREYDPKVAEDVHVASLAIKSRRNYLQCDNPSPTKQINAAKALLSLDKTLLRNSPHPNEALNRKGLRRRDYLSFVLEKGGRYKKIDAAKEIEWAWWMKQKRRR